MTALLAEAKLFTVWELACGDREAVLSLANGDQLELVDHDPVAAAILNTLVDAGTPNGVRPDDEVALFSIIKWSCSSRR